MAPVSTHSVKEGDGTPGLFPTTHCSLCPFLLSLHLPSEPPSGFTVLLSCQARSPEFL